MGSETYQNRLILETSPYLLQHAHNPVDWYPWGNDAFEEAKRTAKPVLLSIGYSACHWCHVMAHESFENKAIADIMNEHFVNIKVDREERPDLDQIYQNAVQLFIRRGGGWPLTMFLTPDKVPFHGGTYFPPQDRYQLPGFPKVLLSLAQAYKEQPHDITATTQNVLEAIGKMKKEPSKSSIAPNLLETATKSLSSIFDPTYGGFGSAPKFPGVPSLDLLLRFYQQSEETQCLDSVRLSLRKMAWGGMYDQIGGGFHRYSVDKAWQIPHFEKMLYDNAQLAPLYFSAFQVTGDPFFKEIGTEILDYVSREMTDNRGGFYAAQDADSPGGEGSFYTWSPEEVTSVLGREDGETICRHYQITQEGNFEGKTIPHRAQSLRTLAEALGVTNAKLVAVIASSKGQLLAQREKRQKPFRDEKIITSWNSLMISAFVTGYQVTRKRQYLSAAVKAADFILLHLYKGGGLLHVHKDGLGKLDAYLDDYAFFIAALLDLYEADSNEKYLANALELADHLIKRFWDDKGDGFYFTSVDHEALIDRTKPFFDQSIPSGNAIAAHSLQRLYYLTGEKTYQEKGERTLLAFASEMNEHPSAVGYMIAAADFHLRRPKEIHIVGDLASPDAEKLLTNIHQHFLPNKVISFNNPDQSKHRSWIQQTKGGEKLSVHICHNFTCSEPMTDWPDILKSLSE